MYREQERLTKKQKRLDARYYAAEKSSNTVARSRKRQNPDVREHEQIGKRRRRGGISYPECKAKFHSALIDGPIYVCTSCHQTWFDHSVVQVEKVKIYGEILEKCCTQYISAHDLEWLCRTCLDSIKSGKVPRLSVANKCTFPPKPEELNLHQLEERMISPRIPFMQMRELPRGGQLSIRGNVVNVPVDVAPTVQSLPRMMSETDTIPVKLKRKLSYATAAFTENIRPQRVVAGLKWLLDNGPVFKDAEIYIDDTWLASFVDPAEGSDEHAFAEFRCPNTLNATNQDSDNDPNNDSAAESDTDRFSEVDNTEQAPGNVDTMLDDAEYDPNQILEFAPGEGKKPLGLFVDPDSEYMAFPTIFCGQRRHGNDERERTVHYSDICKFELRHVDRRVAQSVPNIFFKLKKLQMEQVVNKVNITVRRCKSKGKSYTVADVLDDTTRESIVKLDEGYHIFRTLRSSPPYLEKRKKDLMAMIRQLGCPTWFVSVSAADTHWSDLLRILGKLIDEKDYSDDELKEMGWEDKTRLVRADPVTAARFFDHRLQKFLNDVIKSELHPIGHIQDSFQQRGSPHAHIMFWVHGAPNLDDNSSEEIEAFVDKHTSCSATVSDDAKPYLELQKHKHSPSCRKQQQPICRFGFPKPPMRHTCVLEPLGCEEEQLDLAKANYEKVKQLLAEHKEGMDITFDEFLEQLGLTDGEYTDAVRSSINHTTVFLQRQPSEIRINPYMKNLLDIYCANHDIQFITDPFACAVYIVAYISKSQRGMSMLMDRMCKEARQENFDIRKQVRHIGNAFLNKVEIGAQEAAYLILQLPVTRSSRSVVFINTSPPEERTFLLKSKEKLEEMDPDSTDIECGNVVTRYKQRPKFLQNWCLADYVSKLQITYPENYEDPYDTDYEDDPEHDKDDDQQSDAEDEKLQDPRVDFVCKKLASGVVIKMCKKQKIIRFVNYNHNNDPENYARERLMLYIPWRKEPQDLLGEHETYSDQLNAKKEQVEMKMKQYEPNKALTSQVLEEAMNFEHDDDHGEIVAPNAQQNEGDDEMEGSKETSGFTFFQPDKPEHSKYDMADDLRGTTSTADTFTVLPSRVTDDQFRQDLASLNIKQREFFTHVMQAVTTRNEPIHVFLTGGAGVGKSVVIRTLYQALHRHLCSKEGDNPEECRILLCAPTGKAAYNIGGCTTHSAFHIMPNKRPSYEYQRLTPDRLNTLRTTYRHLSVVIIDEVSMVGSAQFQFIYQRLQELKGNKKPFGGVHMIVVGDLYQLRPVMDRWIFDNSKHGYETLAVNLWKEYFTMHELKEIMRQKDDQLFAKALNRLREGKHTAHDIALFKTRILELPISDPEYPQHVPHLFPTNELVNTYNAQMFSRCTREKVIVKAQDCIMGDRRSHKSKIKSKISTDPSKTAGLFAELQLAVGLRYETVANINVEDGITNGSGCVLKRIHYKQQNNPLPSILWVQFDKDKVGQRTRSQFSSFYEQGIPKEWTPIIAIKRNFYTFDGHSQTSVMRMQFPIRPSAAKNIHKSQGDTMDTVVVNMGSKRPFPHSHYVALSRVTKLEGLHVLDLNEQKINMEKGVAQEIQRLQNEASMQLCYTPMYSAQTAALKIVFQNAQSVHKHFSDLRADHSIIASDIITTAESRLISGDRNEQYEIPGFTIHRNDQQQTTQNRPPHGQVFYFSDRCDVVMVLDSTPSPKVEYSMISLTSPKELQIVTVYKSPGCTFDTFRQKMEELLSHLDLRVPLIIVGDFNYDLFQEQRQFLSFMHTSFNCKQYIDQATTKSGSMLDLVFSSVDLLSCEPVYCPWSYHSTINVLV